MGRISGWVSRYCSSASRTTSERLRFSRLADRSNLVARSAGNRIVNWRSIQISPLHCSVMQGIANVQLNLANRPANRPDDSAERSGESRQGDPVKGRVSGVE